MTQTNSKVYKGADKSCNSLSLHGNLQKKYSQCGNKELFNCDDEGVISQKLLDKAAVEVCSNPREIVDDKVNDQINAAISKVLSQAVSYCFDESLKNCVHV